MNLKSSKLVVGANLFSLSIAYTQNRANEFAPTVTFATYSQIAKAVYGMVHRAQFGRKVCDRGLPMNLNHKSGFLSAWPFNPQHQSFTLFLGDGRPARPPVRLRPFQ